MKEGYTRANAIAKVCQDIILNEIAKSVYFKNVTIKGGVVMHSISNDKRRATRDIDLDFIKYSLDDDSIARFIDKERFNQYIEQIIYNDSEMKEKNIQDVENKLKILFSNKIFIGNLKDARNNWLGIPIDEVLENILDFIQSLEKVQVTTNK